MPILRRLIARLSSRSESKHSLSEAIYGVDFRLSMPSATLCGENLLERYMYLERGEKRQYRTVLYGTVLSLDKAEGA